MSPPKAQRVSGTTHHRTPRSAFDSRLADVALSQRSHRTPRPVKVLGERLLQTPNVEEPALCTGSLLHAYGGLGLRR